MSCACTKKISKIDIFDFGKVPRVNEFLKKKNKPNEKFYPLKICVCTKCLLVQNSHFIDQNKLFKNYKFISKASGDTQKHFTKLIRELNNKYILTKKKSLLEIGSNDGSLLSIAKNYSNDITGVDIALKQLPKKNREKDIKYIERFFDKSFVKKVNRKYDVIIALNVIPHINYFSEALKTITQIMHSRSVLIIEGVYYPDTIKKGQFDTVYHEHAHCFSYIAWERSLRQVGLKIKDVKKINVQGTSLRLEIILSNSKIERNLLNINKLKKYEKIKEISKIESYKKNKEIIFSKINNIKNKFNKFANNSKVIALGAPARGVVIINVCDIHKKITYAIDDTPFKNKLLLPGTNIKVIKWKELKNISCNKFILLSWNYKDEIIKKLKKYKKNSKVFLPFPNAKTINV